MSFKNYIFLFTISFSLGAYSQVNDNSIEPNNYESLSACQKQEIIWNKINETKHSILPRFENFGFIQLVKMSFQNMNNKVDTFSDFAPINWVKYIHRRAVVAKTKFVVEEPRFTGIFTGAQCSLLRLSLTFDPSSRGVAPGLAFKIFRDKIYSANISALYALNGQDQDYNFFRNPLSNIVPTGEGIGAKLVKKIFEKATNKAEHLKTLDMATFNSQGVKSEKVIDPVQLFFIPIFKNKESISSTEHDIRQDLLTISSGSPIYEVRALTKEYANIDYSKYTVPMILNYAERAIKIGTIITTSKFIASSFGDDRLLFRHEVHQK